MQSAPNKNNSQPPAAQPQQIVLTQDEAKENTEIDIELTLAMAKLQGCVGKFQAMITQSNVDAIVIYGSDFASFFMDSVLAIKVEHAKLIDLRGKIEERVKQEHRRHII